MNINKCFKGLIKIISIITSILCLMFIWHLIQEWFNPFNIFANADIDNTIATLFGAFLTGGIAYFAIYETSKLDREARIYEYKANFFYGNLINVYKNIKLSYFADEYFFSSEPTTTITEYFKVMKKEFELNNYNESIYELSQLNSSVTKALNKLYEINNLYIDMYKFLYDKILYFKQLSDDDPKRLFPFFKDIEDGSVEIDICLFVNYYFNEHNVSPNTKQSKKDKIKMCKELILKEFSFDEKMKI